MDVTDLLARALHARASDLHLAAGEAPLLRIDGELQRLDLPVLSADALFTGLGQFLDAEQQRQWASSDELDLALAVPERGRVRLNLFRQQQGPAASLRLLADDVPSVEALGLQPIYPLLAGLRDGLVLVGGPTGSGKSSTLAALLDQLNRDRALHIITLEDPVEILHCSQRSLINQREIGRHSRDFAQALRSALRQDPDIIMLGELRDLETIRLALRAAETGHLVLGTVHTRSAVSSIERLVEVFAAEEKPLVRAMLAQSLRLVLVQVLVKRKGGGRVAAREVLVGTPAVQNLIREGRLAQLHSTLQTSAAAGMQTLEAALQALRSQGLLDEPVG
ncbi:type IV pilus twitching motility protein PilT [Pseudomonas cremoricolorata]|uniref:Twitching motility protein PilT n=1 Tax=Pseudomonas cremoricolorata TaxID=157783 RepID=A0A089WN03_9PSED|nr:PilT/PilU family type 4a pilus ATPase [Pseudomonas cremoricolorata]AIR88534.1 twitching motility protein PilT [Pseudomonas cremoricolorata]